MRLKGINMSLIITYRNEDIQPILGDVNGRQRCSNAYATNGGDIFSCNLPSSQRPDADVDDMMSKLSHGSDNAQLSEKINNHDNGNISNEECIIENQVSRPSVTLQRCDDLKHDSTEQNEYFLSVNTDIDQVDEEGCTSHYKAAFKGQLSKVKNLVLKGADPNKGNEYERKALHVAAEEGHAAIVEFLLDQGADMNAEDDLGQTPLHAAIHNNQRSTAFVLSSNGADVNKRDYRGRTTLHIAAETGNIQIFENLVDKTYDINVEDDMGLTVLHHAVRNGHSNIVNYLLKKGAEETPYEGNSLIFASASFGNLDLVKLFISRVGDVNEENSIGQNPLHVAALNGHLDIIECLVQEGCDINKADHEDFTPVQGAVFNGHLDVLDYLITQGAKITKYDGKSVLHLAAVHGHFDILEYFMKMGADANELDDTGQTPLHVAAGVGHFDIVKYLIERGSKIDKQDHRGYTPLHIAAAKGHLEIVKYLTDQKCSVKEVENAGLTPLSLAAKHGQYNTVKYLADGKVDEKAAFHEANRSGHMDIIDFFMDRKFLSLAASVGDLELVQNLVQQGVDINSCYEKGWTPLDYAIQNNNCEVIDYLLTNGAKAKGKEGSPLYMASRLGHLDAVKVLISRGISVNAESDGGQIPLHAAAATGRIQVVETLIENGSDLNKTDIDGWTPLHAAVQIGHLEVVRYLMWKGAMDIKFRGMTPLYIAAQSGHLDIVDLLLSNDADVNGENDTGCIPLHAVAANGSLEIAGKLIKHGSNVNKMADNGWTPLHAAVSSGRLDLVRYLISNGATKTRFEGMTVLYIAALRCHTELIEYFVTTGCDVNDGTNSGKTPLLAACYNGDMDSVEMLVTQGAYIDQADKNKWTPVHAAAQEGHLRVVTYLVENGADTNFKDTDGITPLQAAEGEGHEDVKSYLIRLRAKMQNKRHKHTGKTDGMSKLQAAGHEDVQKSIIQFRTVVQDERHKDTQKTDGMTPQQAAEDIGHEDVQHLFIIWLRPEVQDERRKDTEIADKMTPLQAAEDARHEGVQQYLNRSGAEMHDEWHNDTDNSFRSDGNCPEMVQGSGMSKVSACDRLFGINRGPCYPMPLNITKASISTQNPWRKNPPLRKNRDTMPRHIKKTIRPTRESCVAKLKTQLYGGEVPATDDSAINRKNSAVDPKPGIKNPRRTNPDSLSRHIKTTIRPTRLSCVSKPKTQLHEGEVPATNNLTITSENDAVNPKPGIKSKRRIIENGLSILTLLLRAIAALAFFFACCPILVAGNLTRPEPVTLEVGTRGVVTFHLQRPSITLQFSLFFTLQFGSKGRAFCINGKYDVDGFIDPSQVSRFTTTVINRDTFPCVNITIDDVHTIDGDQYIFIGVWHSSDIDLYDTQKKEVVVQRPPGPADCFITLSDSEYPYEVHCWAKTGSIPTTLTCYQNNQDLVEVHNITHNERTTRAIFFLPDTTRFSCCSHGITSTVTAATCNDFEWPASYSGIPSTEKTTIRGRSVSEESNRPTDSRPKTDTVGSGACRPPMIPSHWHLLYLLIFLLVFVINIII